MQEEGTMAENRNVSRNNFRRVAISRCIGGIYMNEMLMCNRCVLFCKVKLSL
jgi:hypothetical protein